jgi:flagellar protein FliL
MAETPKEAPAQAAAPGGMKAWLPLILTFLLMPALAYAMTMFILVPRMQKAMGGKTVEARETGGTHASSATEEHGSDSSAAGHGSGQSGESANAGGAKTKAQIGKIIVNVAGSLGSRMLLASFTLVGSSPDLKTRVEEENDQLRDLASTVLATKTISDLEKPESRNIIRTELISQFNAVLGSGAVKEIFITEFAIQ